MLMATALLISGQMKAVDVASWAELSQAIKDAPTATPTTINVTQGFSSSKTTNDTISNGKEITINLGNNPDLVITCTAANYPFVVDNGKLTITGKGKIECTAYAVIKLLGSSNDVADYSTLLIDENVKLVGKDYCVVLQQAAGTKKGYGIVLDVKGSLYGEDNAIWLLGNIQQKSVNIPIINIYADAEVSCSAGGGSDNTAVSIMGYGICNIEGKVSGAVGVYAKAGEINISGSAEIKSTSTEFTQVKPDGNGITGGAGNAIIIDSKDGYAGDIVVNISDEPTIIGAAGYALYEVNTDAPVNHTEGINISGGNFVGGEKGCVSTTPEVQHEIATNGTITGGNYTGAKTEDEIKSLLSTTEGVIVPVVNEYGETVYVVGEKPEGKVWKNSISEASDNDYVKIEATGSETLTADKVLAYLTIVSDYTVTVPAGKTLSVGEIVLDELAKIVVEAGGKLIVNGTNGIVAFNADNLQLKATAESSAIFMLNPAVKANKNPMATVELVSTSFVNGSEFQNQRIAIPFIGAPENLVSEDGVEVRFMRYNDNTDQWDNLGYLNKSAAHSTGTDLDLASLNAPFADFLITVYNTTPGKKLTFTGNLVGISSEKMAMKANWWNSFGNSYIAKMSIKQLLEKLETEFSGSQENIAIYVQKSIGNNKFEWKPITAAQLIIPTNKQNIDAMETFMIKNDGGAMELDIDYKDLIWTPSQQ